MNWVEPKKKSYLIINWIKKEGKYKLKRLDLDWFLEWVMQISDKPDLRK